MTISALQCDYDEINARIAMVLHFNATFSLIPSADQTKVGMVRRAGLLKFYSAYRWSFLRPSFTLSTVAPSTTGTVTIVAGAVTLTGSTWPSWLISNAAGGLLYISGIAHQVATYTNSTHITLVDTTIAADAGTTYSLRQYKYPITNPLSFAGLEGPLYYSPGETNRMTCLESTSDQLLRRYYQQSYWGDTGCGIPKKYALVYEVEDSTAGQQVSIALWPPSDRTYHVVGRKNVVPSDIDGTNKYPAGGAMHSATIMAAILSEANMAYNQTEGEWGAKYAIELQKSIKNDKEINTPDGLGEFPDYSGMDGSSGQGASGYGNSSFWLVPEGFDDQVINS